MHTPCVDWANWKKFETSRYGGGRFIRWAEPEPTSEVEDRYAIAHDESGRVRWWRFSPCPDIPIQQSSGVFYADTADEDAVKAAKAHKAKMQELLHA